MVVPLQSLRLFFFGFVMVIYLFLSLSIGTAARITPSYSSQTWLTENGLPQNAVMAIAQTHDGYLWVGTLGGLARFDGVQFTGAGSLGAPELQDAGIYCLRVARDGSLWIGSPIGLFHMQQGKFSRITEIDRQTNNPVLTIYEAKDNSIWIGTREGLMQWKDGKIFQFSQTNVLSRTSVRAIHQDDDGTFWFGCHPDLIRLQDSKMQIYSRTNGLPTDPVRAICRDRQGNLWLGSNDGLTRMTGGKFYTFRGKEGLQDNFISSLYEDRHANLWVGTYGGFYRFVEGKFIAELNNEQERYDLIYTFFEDREGNMWIGGKDGLHRLNAKKFNTYTRKEGLAHNNVMSVIEDKKGNLWIGTWGGGLSLMTNESITNITFKNKNRTLDLVLGLHQSANGNLWVGTDYEGGLYRLQNNAYIRYTNSYLGSAVRVVHEDAAGNLWAGTSSGLNLIRDNKCVHLEKKDGLPNNIIRSLHEDNEGNIWIGTSGGLARWKKGRLTVFTEQNGFPNDAVLSIYQDANQVFWIGTASHGLFRFSGGKFFNYTRQMGLFSDAVFTTMEDDNGYFWMTCGSGIYRVARKELEDCASGKRPGITSISYGRADGLVTEQCNAVAQPTVCKTKDGRLWFATAKGLSTIDPNSDLNKNDLVPPVVIEKTLSDRKPLAIESGSVRVEPGHRNLEFCYTALSLRSPEKNKFKFKLGGFDSDWVDAGTRRAAYYNNLAPGRYEFHVLACNNDGVWNEKGASLAVIILPHFWQTPAFMIVSIFLTGSTLIGMVRYVSVKKYKHRLALLEQQHQIEKERTRIARDIHDDLGASLTQIALLSELGQKEQSNLAAVTQHFQRISGTARELVQGMDQIVWAVNPKNDTLDNLANYICHFAENFFQLTPVRCRLDVPANLPACALSAELRHNIFLVVKEALHNVVRHAEATEVWIRLLVQGEIFTVLIEDNGKGFEGSPTNASLSDGLENMPKRLESLGGKFSLQSRPGKGTRIQFQIPIKRKES